MHLYLNGWLSLFLDKFTLLFRNFNSCLSILSFVIEIKGNGVFDLVNDPSNLISFDSSRSEFIEVLMAKDSPIPHITSSGLSLGI